MNWPSQVHQAFAIKDGLRPEDFNYAKWPVSNVRLELPNYRLRQKRDPMPILFKCDIDPATPQWNQYDENDQPLPDPVGIVLSRVKFHLVDAGSQDVLAKSSTGHTDGDVQGSLGESQPFWEVVKRGQSVDVKLQATPLFGYGTADGAMHAEYALQNRGYFGGEQIESDVHVITRTEDDELLLDGKRAPDAPPAPPNVYTPEELELQAEMAAEHERVERLHREEAARMAKQQAEIDHAKEVIYGRRQEGQSNEDWLFGVLADTTLPFGTVRKYVYLVAHEVGFEMEQARQRRQEKRDAEAAQRRREYEKRQAEQAQADAVEMVESILESTFSETKEAKAEMLRRIISDPRTAKYQDAARSVADKLGITL